MMSTGAPIWLKTTSGNWNDKGQLDISSLRTLQAVQMKLIYTHENPLMVGNARNILEAARIEVFLKNEYVQSGIGETSPIDTWQELWLVDEKDYERAETLLKETLKQDQGPAWSCSGCGERNEGSFEFCWKCGTAKPDHEAPGE